jgi:hypothetical protein
MIYIKLLKIKFMGNLEEQNATSWLEKCKEPVVAVVAIATIAIGAVVKLGGGK